VLFAERFGVIEAAVENDLFAFGNMSDQNELGPDNVLTGPVWNMEPTVDYVIEQVNAGSFTSQDLKDFSMMAKGGSSLAEYHGLESKIPEDIRELDFNIFHALTCDFKELRIIFILREKASERLRKELYVLTSEIYLKCEKEIVNFNGNVNFFNKKRSFQNRQFKKPGSYSFIAT